VRGSGRPTYLSRIIALDDRLAFERRAGQVAKALAIEKSRPDSLNCEQERRLIIEEWARAHNSAFVQPHLVLAIIFNRRIRQAEAKAALDDVLRRHRRLGVAFEPNVGQTSPERAKCLGDAIHSGVSLGGLHRRSPSLCSSAPTTEELTDEDLRTPYHSSLVGLISAWASEPFDLSRAPLIRSVVLTSNDRCLWVIAADRLVADWWTMLGLHADLEAFVGGSTSLRHDTVFRSPNGSRRALQRRAFQALRHWKAEWCGAVGGPITVSDLPTAMPASELGPSAFRCEAIEFGAELTARLRVAATVLGESVAILLTSALVTTLQHATQKTHVSIWTEQRFAGLSEAADSMGPLSNYHLLTVDLTTSESVVETVRAVAIARARSGPHTFVALDAVWRAMSRCPTVRSGGHIAHQHHERRSSVDGGAPLTQLFPLFDTDSSWALQLHSTDDGARITFVAAYASSRFQKAAVRALLTDVLDVAAGIATEVIGPVGGMSPLAELKLERLNGGRPRLRVSADPATCYLCERRRARGTYKEQERLEELFR
jgi:hypothetical protein